VTGTFGSLSRHLFIVMTKTIRRWRNSAKMKNLPRLMPVALVDVL
jgi:hypothetical protein